jgi:hypothetical protein
MRGLIIGMALVVLTSAQALGLTRHPLGVAQDPENLDGAIYGEALCNLNLRLGPSEEFDSIAVIPGGSEIPIIGWVGGDGGESLWVRTWYGEYRGWACAFGGEERLIGRDGGPLFPLVVVADGLSFDVRKAVVDWPLNWQDMQLKKGSTLEFISVCDNELFSSGWHDCRVYVKYGRDYGIINIYGDKPKRDVDEERGTVTTEPSPWAVSAPPEFTALSLEYQARVGLFEFVGPEEYGYLFAGPGNQYEKLEPHNHYVIVGSIFAEGQWALVRVWGGFGWVYLGTAEEPNIQTYGHFGKRAVIGEDTQSIIYEIGEDVDIGVKITNWPTRNKIYLEMTGPYFSADSLENTEVTRITVYQPPDSDTPLYSGPPLDKIESGWHETGFYSYGATMPETFAPDEPFRVVGDFSFKETQEFEMEFLCNAEK